MSGGLETDTVSRTVGHRLRLGAARRWEKLPRSADLAHFRDLIVHLVRRDLAVRYRGSVLGWLWSLTPALLLLLVTSFFFTRVLPVNVEHFPVFLLVGILAWTLFAAGLQMATGSLESGRSLVLRPGFPTIVLPLVSVLVVFTDYVIALPILFVALAFTSGVSAEALLLPLLLLIQLVFVAGLGLVFAPLQVFYKDTRQFVAVVILAGFWMTPIFYEQKQVPEAFVPLYHANPMAHLIEAQRDILLKGQLPSGLTIGLVAIAGCAVFAGGCAVFSRLKYSLPEKL